ncbi:hypothetical protein HK098_007136 [Nowakowskiella sp. JEL0407]|nr:hypothetical protein HK098_007136 [Nowakowskiella sp. JEL0407]
MEIVIIGGVAGGATCAARLRRLSEDAKITIYEKGPYVSFANCGLPYFVGKIIEKQSSLLLASPELFRDRFNVDVKVLHEVVWIDSVSMKVHIRNGDGETIDKSYDKLVISPGSYPIIPNIPGVKLPGIFTVKNIPDSLAIRIFMAENNVEEAVIVGGGFVGLEMMENLVHLGIKTTVVASGLMPPFDPEMMESVEKHIKEQGVNLQLGEEVSGFESADGKLTVLTKSGRFFTAQIIILAIGVRPDTALAKTAGIKLGVTGGIYTTDSMQTSDPNIYAVGDCVETIDFVTKQPLVVPLAGPANRQGRVAADAIMGRPSKYRGIQGTAVCKVFDLSLACTGVSEKTAKRIGLTYQKVYLHPNHHVGYYPGAQSMKLKLLFDPKDGKVLGCQAVGKEGVDKRVDVVATAIQEAELCYAPQFGAAKDPINLAGMVASNVVRGDAPVAHWNSLDDGFLLDVRSPEEFRAKNAGSAVNIPLPELRKRLGEIPKGKKINVYCGVGQRAYYATRILRLSGFEAFNVSGGMGMFPLMGLAEKINLCSILNRFD